MPRHGKGQKVQTASNQQYGQAQAQEEAQAMMPLPSMDMPSPERIAPGQIPFAGKTQYPNRPITTPGSSPMFVADAPPDEMAQARAASLLPILEAVASMPGASPSVRNLARVARQQLGDASKVGKPIVSPKGR
jgi:hypothetical protein